MTFEYDPFQNERDIEDERNSHVATESEAMREFASNIGDEVPERCWILTSYDVWVRNPHYHGPEVRHPEDYDFDDGDEIEVIG